MAYGAHLHCKAYAVLPDYPHPDHPGSWAHALERMVESLAPEVRSKLLGENVSRIYGLS